MSSAADQDQRETRVIVLDADASEWERFVKAVRRQGFALEPRAPGPGSSARSYSCTGARTAGPIRSESGAVTVGAPSSLSAGVAHEISNPLTAVLANLELALRTIESASASARTGDAAPVPWLAELRSELQDAHEAAWHVRQLVPPAGLVGRRADDEEVEPIDVAEVLEVSLRLAASEVRARAALVKDWGEVPRVLGTALRLGQVFLNLIVNAAQAIDAGQPGDHEIRIVTRTDERGFARIEISDSGVGIPAEDLGRVFTPFFTTKPPGVGSGLGLPICQRIVEELGGRIEIASAPGVGTTVTVLLPPAPRPPTRGPR